MEVYTVWTEKHSCIIWLLNAMPAVWKQDCETILFITVGLYTKLLVKLVPLSPDGNILITTHICLTLLAKQPCQKL